MYTQYFSGLWDSWVTDYIPYFGNKRIFVAVCGGSWNSTLDLKNVIELLYCGPPSCPQDYMVSFI